MQRKRRFGEDRIQTSPWIWQEEDALVGKKKYRITQMYRHHWQRVKSAESLTFCDLSVRRCHPPSSEWPAAFCGTELRSKPASERILCQGLGHFRCPAIINVGDPGQAKKAGRAAVLARSSCSSFKERTSSSSWSSSARPLARLCSCALLRNLLLES